jgi:uncharacterized protein (TIGR03086 family)
VDPKELYLYALNEAAKIVEQVEPEQMELPTPNIEWSVHDLLQHVTYELAWTADIVAGRTVAEVGDKYEGEVLNGDLIDVWRYYETITSEAVETCNENGIAHLSYGDTPVREYLLEAANDQLVHAWDLGQAIGVKVEFQESIAKYLYEHVLSRKEELLGSDLLGAPVDVPESANAQMKLLGLLGRSEEWNSWR